MRRTFRFPFQIPMKSHLLWHELFCCVFFVWVCFFFFFFFFFLCVVVSDSVSDLIETSSLNLPCLFLGAVSCLIGCSCSWFSTFGFLSVMMGDCDCFG